MAAKDGKTFRIEVSNKAKFCRVDLDSADTDYLIKPGHKITDYIFICCQKAQNDPFYAAYFFVELKGVDIDKAAKQIENTIANFRTKHNPPLNRITGYIVSPGQRQVANQKYRNEKERLLKKGIVIDKATNQYTKRYP